MGDPSDPGRRRFMEIGICAISGVIAAVSGVALTRFAIGPSFKKELSKWVEIPFKDVLNAGFKKVVLEYETKEGWLTEHTKKLVYVKKTEGGQPIAVSAECSHLGCIVTWDAERKIFLCPCHEGQFDAEGRVIAGHPPGPLKRHRAQIENGRLYLATDPRPFGDEQSETL